MEGGDYKILKIFTALILAVSLTGLLGLSCGKSNQDKNTQQDTQEDQQPNTETQNGQEDQQPNTEEEGTEENLLTIDPGTLKSDLSERLELAQEKARVWDKKASLTAVQVEVPTSLKQAGVSTRYVFSSPSSKKYHWTIGISADNQNYVRAMIHKNDYLNPDLRVILTQYWSLNFAEALQTADKNGGSEWRKNNRLGKVKLTLAHGQPKGYLYWQVEYMAVSKQGEREPSKDLKIKINAYNGEVVSQ